MQLLWLLVVSYIIYNGSLVSLFLLLKLCSLQKNIFVFIFGIYIRTILKYFR